ncbi:MAG: hypothetical protein IK081_03090, partial [Lachnospiraceae bacterium]|nr:hypothetical protein [Lachnospiraceae bacterium]
MKKWIKRIIITLVSCVFILGMASCGDKTRLMISPVIQEMLEREGIKNSYVSSIGDYKDVRKELSIPQVTEKEFEAYFEEEFSKYGSLSDSVVQEAFGYASVQELKENERISYLEHLKFMELMEARSEVMQQLISRSSFQLDEA